MPPLLEPLHNIGEILRGEVSKRNEIPLTSGLTCLGKNAVTGIADSGLRRKMVQIRAVGDIMQLEVLGAEFEHQVQINWASVPCNTAGNTGQRQQHPLQHGDILSLLSTDATYSYRVVLEESSIMNTSAAAPISKEDQQRGKKRKTGPSKRVADEITCPICLELYVQATMLTPCGHMACAACVPSEHCMTCRSPYQSATPCHAMDSVVAALVADGIIGNEEGNVGQYQHRLSTAGS